VWLQRAALIHSIYGTDAYAPQLIGPARRGEVRALVGERIERLAHLFCVTPRGPLLAGTLRWARALPMRTLAGEADSGVEPGGHEPASAPELDALVLLHMANLADQARAADGSPSRWLVRLRDLGELLDDSDTITIPPCVTALAELTEADEQLALRSYAQAAGATSVSRASALALAATACRVIGEPCAWLAHLARCEGDDAAARSWARHARERLLALGTAWDKRLTFEEWLAVIDALERPAVAELPPGAAAITEPRTLRDAITDAAAAPARPPQPPAADGAAGRRRFERYVEGLVTSGAPGSGGNYPDLASRPWHDPGEFPLVAELEARFAEIRAEVLALDDTRFQRESERIGRTGDWDVVFLYDRGRRHDAACAACPVTARAIEVNRTVRTVAGLVYISRMRPGTRISAHRGPTNLRLRCHLAVAVPEGDCAIRVGAQTERWREGECLVFDDSYDHDAWNHTNEDRIVLIVDLWHPGLSDVEVRLLEGLHAYAYRHARRLSRYWAANDAAAREPDRNESTWA
jgi:aspartate beta-hydroxylase